MGPSKETEDSAPKKESNSEPKPNVEPESQTTSDTTSDNTSNPRTPVQHTPLRRQRQVVYRSSALQLIVPKFVAFVDSSLVQRSTPISAAHRFADSLRDNWKTKEGHPARATMSRITGVSKDEKARRYDRRMQLNRRSAMGSRIRRDAYVKALEYMLYRENLGFNQLRALVGKQSGRDEINFHNANPSNDGTVMEDTRSFAPEIGSLTAICPSVNPETYSAPSNTPLTAKSCTTDGQIGEMAVPSDRTSHDNNDSIVNDPSIPNGNTGTRAPDTTNSNSLDEGFEDVFDMFSDNAMAFDNVEVPDFSGWDFDSFDGAGADGEEHH